MDRVGGYRDLLAIEENSQRYELVLIAIAGDAQAAKLARNRPTED